MINIFLIIAVFSCLNSVCADIRCYMCQTQAVDTLYAERCGDDFRLIPRDASLCLGGGTCQKTRGYRTEGSRRVVEITRNCVPYHADGCEDGSHNGISASICYCNTEYCNSSNFIQGSVWLCVLMLVILCFMYIKRT